MNNIQTHFTKTIADYDTVANKVVFKNDELHEALINAIPFSKNQKLKILDLGCGTGHGIELIAKKFPNAQITGIDFSPKMIAKAQKHLKKYLNRINLIEADFRNFQFDQTPQSNQKYDLIISAIAIHNISHPEKEKLFKKIFSALKKGGCFINGDFHEHENSALNKQLQNIYRNFLSKNLKGPELKVWLKHAFEDDMPMKLSKQQKILEKIGFSKFELIWIFNNQSIYISSK